MSYTTTYPAVRPAIAHVLGDDMHYRRVTRGRSTYDLIVIYYCVGAMRIEDLPLYVADADPLIQALVAARLRGIVFAPLNAGDTMPGSQES